MNLQDAPAERKPNLPVERLSFAARLGRLSFGRTFPHFLVRFAVSFSLVSILLLAVHRVWPEQLHAPGFGGVPWSLMVVTVIGVYLSIAAAYPFRRAYERSLEARVAEFVEAYEPVRRATLLTAASRSGIGREILASAHRLEQDSRILHTPDGYRLRRT